LEKISEFLAAPDSQKGDVAILGDIALESWNAYWHLTIAARGLSVGAISDAMKVIDSLHARDIYPDRPIGLRVDDSKRQVWDEGVSLEFAQKVIRRVIHGYEPLTEEQIVDALSTGSIVHEIIPNITAANLEQLAKRFSWG